MSITPISILVYSSLLIGVLVGLVIRYTCRSSDCLRKINKYIDSVLVYVVYLLIVSIGLMTGVHLKKVVIGYTSILSYIVVLSLLPTLLGFVIAVALFRVVALKR